VRVDDFTATSRMPILKTIGLSDRGTPQNLISNFLLKQYLKLPQHLNHVGTYHLLKNCDKKPATHKHIWAYCDEW